MLAQRDDLSVGQRKFLPVETAVVAGDVDPAVGPEGGAVRPTRNFQLRALASHRAAPW